MEEPPFDDLHQAAVAGAEGTAWAMPEFAACPPLPICYPSFSPSPAFDTLPPVPHPHPMEDSSSTCGLSHVKEEPAHLHPPPIPSSPPQPSLCSLSSEESFFHATNPVDKASTSVPHQKNLKPSIPSSPVSNTTKQRSASRSTFEKQKPPIAKSSATESHFSHHDLTDLRGTTAARSRKMTDDERKIMLHKRRLRNRASAARSREKRSRTLMDLTSEVEDLIKKTAALSKQAQKAVEDAQKMKAQNFMLAKENELLKAELKILPPS